MRLAVKLLLGSSVLLGSIIGLWQGLDIPRLLAEFGDWAYDRHANVLSWYIRPLFLLPLAWFAYRRSGWGIAGTLVALATSIFWFPAPAQPDPQVLEFSTSNATGSPATGTPRGSRCPCSLPCR